MIFKRILRNEQGLLVVFFVTAGLAALVGGATFLVVANNSTNCSSVYRKLEENQPVSQEEFDRCRNEFPQNLQIATAGGSFVAAVDSAGSGTIESAAGNVISNVALGATSNYVDRASTPRPSADNPLPPDAAAAAAGGTAEATPTPTAEPEATATATPEPGNEATPTPTPAGETPSGCSSGTFTCNNGQQICAELACNQAPNCSDGSDEGERCSTTSGCCVSTNGCPGETGSNCADTCCCCPLGQACNRGNPQEGCIASARVFSEEETHPFSKTLIFGDTE